MKGTLIFTLTLLLGVAGFLTTGFAQTYDHHDTLNEGTGLARALAFSPDGTLLASGGGRNVYLHDPGTGMLERTLRGHTAVVTVVAFSPDGRMLASASGDRTIKLWNPQTGRLIRTLRGHTNQIYAMAFSRTGQLASGGRDNTVRLWNTQTGTNRLVGRHGGWVLSVAFSSTGLLASSGRDNTIWIWNATTVAPLRPLIGHTNFVTSVAFTATGDTLVSGSRDNTLRIWAATGGAALQTLRGHTDAVNCVAVSVNGTIASASADETVRLWKQTGQRIATFNEHTDLVRVAVFSPNGQYLASGSVDGTVQVYSRRSGTVVPPIVVPPVVVPPVVVPPGGPGDVEPPGPGGGGGTVNPPATGIQVTITPNPAGTNIEIGANISLTVKVSRDGQGLPFKQVTLEATTDIPERLTKVTGFDKLILDAKTPMKATGITDNKGEVKAALKVKPLATAGTFKLIAKVPEFNATRELSFTVGTGADELAGDLKISTSNTTVEPKAGSYNGRIPLTFRVTAKSGNALRGERIAVSERTTRGSVTSQLSSANLTTDGNGQATTNLDLQNSSTGEIRVTAHVEGSEPRVSKELTITVGQTAHDLSVSGVPSSITSGETRTITATVTSINGTRMAGVTVYFRDQFDDDPNDSEIAFSTTSRKTNSSGQVSTTLRTGSKGSAKFRVEASGVSSSKWDTFALTVERDTDYTYRTYSFSSRRAEWEVRGLLGIDSGWNQEWYDEEKTYSFPGPVIDARITDVDISIIDHGRIKVDYIEDRDGVSWSGKSVTVYARIYEHIAEPNEMDVEVKVTYEVLASSPGAPPAHPLLSETRVLQPETDSLSTFWQDLSQVPETTALLPNYPNPFNPETWIPYRLAESAEVTLSIYSLNGNRVRTLALGHQPAGFYESRSRAAYWDGRNATGERVASGVYFYTLTAGDFAATSKMLILK